MNQQLEGKQYLMGDTFSVADAYLFTVANWGKFVGVDISSLAHLGAFMAPRGRAPGRAGSAEGRRPAQVGHAPCVRCCLWR